MKHYPAQCVKKQSEIKTGRYAERIIINNCAQVVEAKPGKHRHNYISKNVPTYMNAGLIQRYLLGLPVANFIQNLMGNFHGCKSILNCYGCFGII